MTLPLSQREETIISLMRMPRASKAEGLIPDRSRRSWTSITSLLATGKNGLSRSRTVKMSNC